MCAATQKKRIQSRAQKVRHAPRHNDGVKSESTNAIAHARMGTYANPASDVGIVNGDELIASLDEPRSLGRPLRSHASDENLRACMSAFKFLVTVQVSAW
jgi:hypothetical protein